MNIIKTMSKVPQLLVARLYTRGMSRADRQRGISALEYIILAVLIVLVVAGAATVLGPKITSAFGHVGSKL